MGTKLSRRMAPSAKKLYLVAPRDQKISALVMLAPSTERLAFQQSVAQHRGRVSAWMPETNIASVDIDAGCLSDLADLDGVVYVEAGQSYKP